jgi:enterochelin esterase family protein
LGGDRPNRGGDPKANTEALKAAGINAHFYVSPETAHEWQSWRRSLHEFAQASVVCPYDRFCFRT